MADEWGFSIELTSRNTEWGNSFLAKRTAKELDEDGHCYTSDRWRHGCRRRAYRDIFTASHWETMTIHAANG